MHFWASFQCSGGGAGAHSAPCYTSAVLGLPLAAAQPPLSKHPSLSTGKQPEPPSLRFNVHYEMFVIINYDNSENSSHK